MPSATTAATKIPVVNSMSENSTEHYPREEKTAESILYDLGLDVDSLKGKTILDVGSGERILERSVKERMLNATVVSFDSDMKSLQKGNNKDKHAVRGDAFAGFPFRDESFDLLINSGGPVRGFVWDEEALSLYEDSLRILKLHGELRTNDPFKHDIAEYLYYQEQDGDIALDSDELESYKEKHREYMRQDLKDILSEEETGQVITDSFDERGRPIPWVWGNQQFWFHVFAKLPKEEQVELYSYCARRLAQTLKERGENVSIVVKEPEMPDTYRPTSGYSPYLVMKKLASEDMGEVEVIAA